jgi:hypothetical protein
MDYMTSWAGAVSGDFDLNDPERVDERLRDDG